MSKESGYKEQFKLSLMQFLSGVPGFLTILVSAILSKSLLVFVDVLDSFSGLLRSALVVLLSKKLSKDLRYEYNYGVGKFEAISSMLCDGIVLFGLIVTIGVSIHAIIFPSKPSDMLIAVVGLKVINVSAGVFFVVKQHKILKSHSSAISQVNYAGAVAALLFDIVALVSLLAVWLLRNSSIGEYITPILTIIVAIYLMIGCIKRSRSALDELTDKTLPEEMQMKILNVMTRFYHSYSQVHSINSHKSGNVIIIDIHLSFDIGTMVEEIVDLKIKMQEELKRQIGPCDINIIIEED